ncbi:hypothetical protein C5167_012737 [Papaver somniferum]|uniref:Glycosyltransferase n=1 Tax=Papaver somniferum TaxID=3469 RepID=A0A4Y7J2K6_PAPSO|nr:7-deoxyloganetin glucosyltransferase-like [Papaver somniferum]RZC53875.1 hypothetical protein C5167_012737 [Papaver somniferum]
MSSTIQVTRHVVCIPFPAQGHINPMLKLAKLLHNKGIYITFVNTEFNHKRLIKSRGVDSVKGLPDFQFHTIPDGLPPSDVDSTQDIDSLCFSTKKNCGAPFRNLLTKLDETPDIPRVTCVVSDGHMSFTLAVAKEFGLPEYLFWTTSACGFMGYLHYRHLLEKGLILHKDEGCRTIGFLETVVDIPGFDNIRLMDFPAFARITDPNDKMIEYILGETENATKASGIILNTFDELENEVVEAMRSGNLSLPPLFTLGALHILIDQIQQTDELKSVGSNLWKEEPECLRWLNTKEPNSVVYVNFGSITVMTTQQLIEFAWGLANSKQTFLWVIRPDLVQQDSAKLPIEFLEETKERSLFPNWCPQEEVLNHPAIGGFLTHCGWNSTLESIYGGVPMICWPFFAEQQTNCRYACKHWGIGMEIDNNVKRDEVEELVKELMEGDKGKEMKSKAMVWKRKGMEAVAPGGSSYVNLNKIVDEILHASSKIIS